MFAPGRSLSQCIPTSSKTISYSTVLHGTGNNSWGFLIPQFNPAQGTLIAVNIKAMISLNYSFQLENNANISVPYHIDIERRDSISSNGLSSPIDRSVSQDYGSYNLEASDGLSGSGSDFIQQGPLAVMSSYVITDSVTAAVSPFIGSGYATFYYDPATTATVSGNSNYSFTGSATDTMHFQLTYYYCNTVVLASTITHFWAAKESDEMIKLSWTTQNELAGRNYEIEKSDDGKNFLYLQSIPSNVDSMHIGNYLQYYHITNDDRNKVYFRLKEIDADGTIGYSEIRVVDLGSAMQGISLYPNPSSSFINLIFNEAGKKWMVAIFASHGGLVQQNDFENTNYAHIPFTRKLAPGVYFVRAYEEQSQKNYVTSFLVY